MKILEPKKFSNLNIHLVILAIFYTLNSYSQTYQWATSAGNTANDYGMSVSTDVSGNVYSTGSFNGVVDFDPGPGTTTLATFGSADCYIQKLSSTGTLVWIKQIGGSLSDGGKVIKTDNSGNIFIAGNFQGVCDFNPGAGVFTLTSNGNFDAFVTKLDPSGNFLWAKAFGSTNIDVVNNLAINSSGDVVLAGRFDGAVDFDPGAGVNNITSAGSADGFIDVLNSSGNFLWAGAIGGSLTDEVLSVDLDASGNIYASGFFNGTADFDPGVGSYTIASASSFADCFILKFNPTGNFAWAKSVGGSQDDRSNSINVDVTGDVYVSGYFSSTVDFDPGPGTSTVTAAGGSDGFLLKLNSSGNHLWNKQFSGTGTEIPLMVDSDIFGNVYTTGYFIGVADFDPGVGTYTLSCNSVSDVFLVKLDNAGNFIVATSYGGLTNDDAAYSMTVDNNCNVYTTGVFTGTTDLNPGTAVSSFTSLGANDIFTQKLNVCTAPPVPINTTPTINLSICPGQSTTLTVSSTGTVSWYSTPTGGSIFALGSPLNTGPLSTGTYTFYAEALTCTLSAARAPIIITVNPNPSVSISASTGSVCAGGSATLTGIGATSYSWSTGSNSITTVVSPTAITIYTVTGFVGSCLNTNTISVGITTSITVNTSISNATICAGESSTITASGASTYTWNTNSNTGSIVVSPTITTTYSVNGASGSCGGSAITTVSVNACVNIKENYLDGIFSLYPNPTTGMLHLDFFEHTNLKDITIKVTNILGQVVWVASCEDENKVIDIQHLPNGLYYFSLKQNNANSTVKIIKN